MISQEIIKAIIQVIVGLIIITVGGLASYVLYEMRKAQSKEEVYRKNKNKLAEERDVKLEKQIERLVNKTVELDKQIPEGQEIVTERNFPFFCKENQMEVSKLFKTELNQLKDDMLDKKLKKFEDGIFKYLREMKNK